MALNIIINLSTQIYNYSLHINYDNTKALKYNSKGFNLVMQTPCRSWKFNDQPDQIRVYSSQKLQLKKFTIIKLDKIPKFVIVLMKIEYTFD